MPRTRRWLLAILVIVCVVVAPIQAPGSGFADELRDLRSTSNADTASDSEVDSELESELDFDFDLESRLDGIQFPNDDTLKAGFFSRSWSSGLLPDPAEYVARDGVGGGPPMEFQHVSADGTRVFPLAHGSFRVSQDFGCVPLDPGYALADFCPPERPSFHTGIDFAADEGTTIYAAATGTVNFADIDRTSESGNSIVRIIHDGSNSGYVTEYYHWRKSFVEAGEYVIAGQPIGEVGSVGYSSGPHLHFGVFDADAGEYIEPLNWLKGSESRAVATGVGGVGGSDGVMQWASLIEVASNKHGIPAALIAAIITVESGGNPEAVSPVGAQGLMQIMPMHLERFEVPKTKWRDPATNIDAGTRLLAELLAANGTLTNAVAAYFGFGCDVLGTCTDEYVAAVFAWYTYYVPIFQGVAVDAGEFEFEIPDEPIVARTPTPSPSPSPEPTATPEAPAEGSDATPTPGPSPSPTPSPSPSPSPTPGETPEPTPSPSPSPTPGETPEPTPSPSPSPTPEPTETPEPTPSPSPTPEPTETPEPTPTPEPSEDEEEPRDQFEVEGFDSRWVTDYDAGVVLRMNLDDDGLIAMIELGAEPGVIAISESAVWVSVPGEKKIVRIDPETNEVAERVELEAVPGLLLVTDDGLWVTLPELKTLVLIDLGSNEIRETVELDVQPCGLEKNEQGLHVTDCETGELITPERE